MNHEEVLERVKSVTSNVLKTDEKIDDTANFIFDLGADSLQSVQLVAAFEEEFDIELDEDNALKVQSVSDAAKFIKEHLEK